MSKQSQPKHELLSVITELQKEVNVYKSKENANKYIIDKRLDLIDKLKEIESNLNFLEKYEFIKFLASEIDAMRLKDSNIQGFLVEINFAPKHNKYASIKLNYYAQ